MSTSDRDRLIGEFFRRLDELEKLADEITTRLAAERPLPSSPNFELVVICTGNRVRSPVAEGFLRALLRGLPVRVSSAGTLDLGPVPPLPETLENAGALGLDVSAHRARCIDTLDLGGADLVIGFELRHVATAVVDSGASRARAYTILELVDLLQQIEPPPPGDPVARAREAISRAHALRRSDSRASVKELADPLGGSSQVFRDTVTRVRSLCELLAVGLFGAEAVTPLPDVPELTDPGNSTHRPRRGFAGLRRNV